MGEVAVQRCFTFLEDAEPFTRIGTGKRSLIPNPSGVCCRSYLRAVVGSVLVQAGPGARRSRGRVATAVESPEEPWVAEELNAGGMDCESCTLSVVEALELAGVPRVSVDFGKGSNG